MSTISVDAFFALVDGRRGHFRLESGHHGGLWLDLDALFANIGAVAPFVDCLTSALRPHALDVVCGPLLGGAFLAQLVAQRLGAEFCFTERRIDSRAEQMYRASYHLAPAFKGRVRGKRVAMVDDVMSAGSALRGTYNELLAHDAVPVVAGALLVLGSTGADFFTQRGVAVENAARHEYALWLPSECPLCAAGVVLEDIALADA